MFADIADEYLERVEECRLEARRCSRAEERDAWLSLAEEWLRLVLRSPANANSDELCDKRLTAEHA